MPSPVVSTDFDLSNFAGDVCQQITQLIGLSGKLKTWFEWAFDSDGNPTQEFKDAMAIIPVGLVAWKPASSVPTGWLICNGQAVSRTTYANLFNIIGTNFGAGDGSTTFNLPDLQGRMLMGAGSGFAVGEEGGADEQTVTLTAANIPPHRHAIGVDDESSGYVDNGVVEYHGSCDGGIEWKLTAGDTNQKGYTELYGGTNNAATPVTVTTLPPYTAGLWLIKT